MMTECDGGTRLKKYVGPSPELEDVCSVLNASDNDVRGVVRRLDKKGRAGAADILKRLKHVQITAEG